MYVFYCFYMPLYLLQTLRELLTAEPNAWIMDSWCTCYLHYTSIVTNSKALQWSKWSRNVQCYELLVITLASQNPALFDNDADRRCLVPELPCSSSPWWWSSSSAFVPPGNPQGSICLTNRGETHILVMPFCVTVRSREINPNSINSAQNKNTKPSFSQITKFRTMYHQNREEIGNSKRKSKIKSVKLNNQSINLTDLLWFSGAPGKAVADSSSWDTFRDNEEIARAQEKSRWSRSKLMLESMSECILDSHSLLLHHHHHSLFFRFFNNASFDWLIFSVNL